jgi:hypothetical protein
MNFLPYRHHFHRQFSPANSRKKKVFKTIAFDLQLTRPTLA